MAQKDHEITVRMHTLLGSYMKDREADKVLQGLNELDENDFDEFTKLMQEWNHCRWNESR
jgi:hypothetical protein